MKRIRVLICLLFFCFSAVCSLSACASAPVKASDFDYAEGPFSAAIRGTYTPADGSPRPVAAAVTVGAPTENSGERSMTISFSEPSALFGVTVSVGTAPDEISPDEISPEGISPEGMSPRGTGRVVTFTAATDYGEIQTVSAHGKFDGFLRFAEALLPHGDVVEVSPVSRDGTHTVTRRTTEGETVYLFGETGGLPLQVTVTTPGEILTLTVSGEN